MYCSDSCRVTAYQHRKRGKGPSKTAKASAKSVNRIRKAADYSDKRGSGRRGPDYERFCKTEFPDLLIGGQVTNREVAAELDTTPATVTRWLTAYVQDRRTEAAVESHQVPEEAQAALDDFEEFRARYFRTPDVSAARLGGVPYLTPAFQKKWIGAVIETIGTGGRLMILSPPRHGKSEMLTHFACWSICKNPNVRILWVGLNEDIAKQSVELVREELENNERLRVDFVGEEGSFRPPARSGKTWTDSRFHVATRTIASKSATMTAVGRGGKLLSRDADLIIVDDIIDHSTVASPTQREADLRWLRTQVSSRKEEHTGMVVIGSRQHPDDLYAHLLENKSYRAIVEQAHDDACTKDPAALDEHTDCVLFPELRTYKWLMSQRDDVGPTLFDMVYQNRPHTEGISTFTRELIDPCKNALRAVGHFPKGLRLIAGLDPAPSGFQASFLWGVDVESMKRYCVDLDNTRGGGLPGANAIIKAWFAQYGLRHWIIESNNYQGAILQDFELRRWCAENGVVLEPYHTHQFNKFDPQFGVSTLAEQFAAEKIDLPYADDGATRGKVDEFVRQLINWEGQRGSKGPKSDLVMASWFPEKTIRNWRREFVQQADVGYSQTPYPWQSAWSSAPWRSA